ncbi:MAG: helix-hairpin-helix domain-containing protein [Prevotella sp.]|uniref:helix-hairpin-helix domain-containing protein n=1 Tax=Prevotella sp. TaxID=59823 RepID=UPI002A2F58E8|nr:helix-hairpin-helix domain-containing protein [Prevotella sp.]MDD7318866.1 helix-hairpin-helix domain-containing protein [Prevotellaceae bacterium]MDY4019244.1 helix-hairpin-helix domain-containing protein [Prevotella sp.]
METHQHNILRTSVLLLLLLPVSLSFAQNDKREWESLFNDVMSMEDSETLSWQETYDMLCELDDNPIDLNTATREDIETIPFLTEIQVMDICEYLYKYAPMKTLGELAMIESLDYYRRELLRHFVVLGDVKGAGFPTVDNIMKYGGHELLATAKLPFYKRRGDDKGYLGGRYAHSFKYTFSYGQYVKAGLLGSQDAGEPFFTKGNSLGYDFYSYYIQLRKMGRLKSLVLGRYKAKFGMGLVMNNDFMLGKMASLQQPGSTTYNIRAHSSRMEANYLQGMAATVELAKGIDVTAFVSYRDIDATLNKDLTIATILDNGYHRTEKEMEKKNNSSVIDAGMNISFRKNGWRIGATGVFSHLSRDLRPNTAVAYRRFYPMGNNLWNASVNYAYISHRWQLSGETATGGCGALATINTVSYRLTDELDIVALQRFYSKKYYSLYSGSFSEGGNVQNESGLYTGINWHPSANFRLNGYFDIVYFPWAKYQSSFASHSYDAFVLASYIRGRWDFLARYRIKVKEKDNQKKTALTNRVEQLGRVAVRYDGGTWTLKTQADIAHVSYKDNDFGWMLSETLSMKPLQWLSVEGNLAYFDTDGFDSRIYIYEKGTLYSFNFPSFYGNGIRYSVLARADVSRKLMFIAKIGTTNYFDRNTIGTGLRKINHSSMTDLELQLRLKL